MDPEKCLDFGRHYGETWGRVPVRYLHWMVQVGHTQQDRAAKELKRRGSEEVPELDISKHAVDRASLRLLNDWQQTRRWDEGLYSWLLRKGLEALEKGEKEDTGIYVYEGVQWVFQSLDLVWPTLKTVIKRDRED